MTEPRRRAGPVYDDAMKILAEDDLPAVLAVLGVPGPAQPLNVELASSSIRADLVARTSAGIAHVEYVTEPTADLPLRMVEYRLRLRRRYPDLSIAQYVLALRERPVPDRYDDAGLLVCRWTVVRLADLDPYVLLRRPTTAALAALAHGTEPERAEVLTTALSVIAARISPAGAPVLLDAALTLASLVLSGPIIDTALKEATMPVPIRETPWYRRWYEEGEEAGREEGRQEGERRAAVRLTILLLRRRFGDDPRIPAAAERLADLPDEARLDRIAALRDLDDAQR